MSSPKSPTTASIGIGIPLPLPELISTSSSHSCPQSEHLKTAFFSFRSSFLALTFRLPHFGHLISPPPPLPFISGRILYSSSFDIFFKSSISRFKALKSCKNWLYSLSMVIIKMYNLWGIFINCFCNSLFIASAATFHFP